MAVAGCLVAWRRPDLQRVFGIAGAFGLLATGLTLVARTWSDGILVSTMGGWPSPFGISLVIDLFSAIMITLAGLMGAAVAVYSLGNITEDRVRLGFYPLLNALLMGVCGAFSTGDIFNLYVWFEVMLLSSFVLLGLGGDRGQIIGSVRYVALNLLSSMLFLMGAGLLYGTARSLNMADLALRLPQIAAGHPDLMLAVSAFFFVSFALKAGIFPLYFWLPVSYHTPPAAIAALFAGLLTKVGVYALIRVFGMVLPPAPELFELTLILAGATMLLGVLGAVSQIDMRRVLSFHVLSQIGYMVLAFGLLAAPDESTRRLGIAAAVLYITHHIIVKTNLFLIGGLVRDAGGSFDLDSLGGLARRVPWLALLFLIPALSLAGIPPLSGFWAKLAVLEATLVAGRYVLAGVAVLAGLLTLLSMLKIWNQAFWRAAPSESTTTGKLSWTMVVPVVVLALCTVVIGLYPEPFAAAADRAASQILDTAAYIDAVLGDSDIRLAEEVGR